MTARLYDESARKYKREWEEEWADEEVDEGATTLVWQVVERD